MKITLISLEINNFKGIHNLTVRADGESLSIYGDNGTGKTTIYDAYCWLLFGVDSRGVSNFDIEPRDAEGKVIDPEAVTEVVGVFDLGDRALTLRKRCQQKWVRVRGREELTYTGNTCEYEFNNIPCTMREYQEKLDSLADSHILRIISNVSAFASLPWAEQRTMLFDLLDAGDDLSIMETEGSGKYALLAEEMLKNDWSLDELIKKSETNRKLAVTRQNNYPVAIEENKRLIEGDVIINVDALTAERIRLEGEVNELLSRRSEVVADVSMAVLSSALSETESEIFGLKRENLAYIKSQSMNCNAKYGIDGLRKAEKDAMDRADTAGRNADMIERDAARIKVDYNNLRDKYSILKNTKYNGSDKCPTCKRKYDAEYIAKAKEIFDAETKSMLEKIKVDGQAISERMAAINSDAERERAIESEAKADIESIRAKISEWRDEQLSETNMEGYAERLADLEAKRDDLAARYKREQDEKQKKVDELSNSITKKRGGIAEINRQIGDAERTESIKRRIRQLESEMASTGQIVAQFDRIIALADDYTLYKAKKIEGDINDHFRMVRFKLYETQKNGGIRYCCEATVDGIGYNKNLNTSARINSGIDIINAFSRKCGVYAPMFIDNAESISELTSTDTQQIRLVVSADDKTLRY